MKGETVPLENHELDAAEQRASRIICAAADAATLKSLTAERRRAVEAELRDVLPVEEHQRYLEHLAMTLKAVASPRRDAAVRASSLATSRR